MLESAGPSTLLLTPWSSSPRMDGIRFDSAQIDLGIWATGGIDSPASRTHVARFVGHGTPRRFAGRE